MSGETALRQHKVDGSADPSLAVRRRGRWEQRLLDAVGVVIFTFAAMAYLQKSLRQASHLSIGLFLFYLLIVICVVLRRSARRQAVWWESLLAWSTVAVPLAGLRPTAEGYLVPGLLLQSLGLAAMLAALASLGRSFGIAPADRGLVTGGLYRWVRHPLYAAELLFNAGFLMLNPSWRNLAVLALMLTSQVVRIHREERILGDYASYARQVRWRLLPGVW